MTIARRPTVVQRCSAQRRRAMSCRLSSSCPSRAAWPGFDGATGWLNSPPLTPDGLRGKVVLVDFWTYTCINWLRTLGYVRAWAEKYADQGLVVVGVHTPEFPFERDVDNVRRAVEGHAGRVSGRARQRLRGLAGVQQPLLARRLHRRRGGTDPAPPLRRGRVRGVRAGHPAVAARGRARGLPDDLVSVADEGFEAQADWANLESPETYLGYEQAAELRVARWRRASTSLGPTSRRTAEAQPVGARGGLDGRAAGRAC